MAASNGQIRIVFNHFPQIKASLAGNAAKAVADTAQGIQSKAQGSAPVDTGNLRGSISASAAGANTWRVTAAAEYAMFVEFGSGHGPAQPYFVPAVHEAEPDLIAKLTSYLAAG